VSAGGGGGVVLGWSAGLGLGKKSKNSRKKF